MSITKELEALVVRASGHFLTERLPEDWNSNPAYPDNFLETFIEEHKWEPFERYDADEIAGYIECLSTDMAKLVGVSVYEEGVA